MSRPSLSILVLGTLLLSGAVPAASAPVPLEEGVQQLATDLATTLEGSEIRKIAVVEFQDINGYPSALGPFIVEELVTQLFVVRPGQFEIVERRQLARVLSEQKLTASGLFDEETIAEIGKILGIQAIVTGSIADLGTSVKLNVRAIAVDTAKVFAATSATVARDETVESLLRQSGSPDTSGSGRSPGPIGQPSDVYFQNNFLRVTVASIGVREDSDRERSYVTLSLVFENLTTSDLLVIAPSGCGFQLVDDLGARYEVREISGIDCVQVYALANFSRYSLIGSKARSTIVLELYSEVPTAGNLFSLGGELYRQQGKEYQKFSVGISNIRRP